METVGRRERKKAQTRQALSDAATRLFRERGFDAVTVAQVADEADVSLATLFKHFPEGKESLVFVSGEEVGKTVAELVAERPAGTTVLDALELVMQERGPFETEPSPGVAERIELIAATPALRDHARRRWLASFEQIARLFAEEAGREVRIEDRALARYALEIPDIASDEPDPRAALHRLFARLRQGWDTRAPSDAVHDLNTSKS